MYVTVNDVVSENNVNNYMKWEMLVIIIYKINFQ